LEFNLIKEINNPHEKVIKEIIKKYNDKKCISISVDYMIKIWDN
jgi:hypothetical protein